MILHLEPTYLQILSVARKLLAQVLCLLERPMCEYDMTSFVPPPTGRLLFVWLSNNHHKLEVFIKQQQNIWETTTRKCFFLKTDYLNRLVDHFLLSINSSINKQIISALKRIYRLTLNATGRASIVIVKVFIIQEVSTWSQSTSPPLQNNCNSWLQHVIQHVINHVPPPLRRTQMWMLPADLLILSAGNILMAF